MRQRAAASLLYQSQHAEPAFRNLQKLIFLKIVGRILAFYSIAAEVAEMAVQKCDVVAVEVVYFHCQISFLN